ncbi:hypothetical protein VPH35_125797 [Triticum aestivum]
MVLPSRKRRCRDLRSAAAATRTSTTTVSPPADIIFEILSWLPTKSLGRCRCVSKKWLDLISNPAFVAAHRSSAEPLLVAMTDHSSLSVHPRCLQLMDTDGALVRVLSLPGAWWFHASLDGLAYITFRKRNSVTHAVVDLATGVTLTNLRKQTVMEYYMLTYIGFGRTTRSGVYKLLRLNGGANQKQTCEVLTVGDDTNWRQTQPTPMIVCQSYACPGVSLNGAFHFLSRDENRVLCFGLESEEWKQRLGQSVCDTRRKVVKHVLPLRVLGLGGGLLFYYTGNNLKPKLQVYNRRLRRCTTVKTPNNLLGRISLCNGDLNPRFCDQP